MKKPANDVNLLSFVILADAKLLVCAGSTREIGSSLSACHDINQTKNCAGKDNIIGF